ncbi:MAG TPA: DUF6174 domain-containing protein [Blastocatellia bacterium]|nr:DUF6174 domain-containing protein [Blastocatellia bacterium]
MRIKNQSLLLVLCLVANGSGTFAAGKSAQTQQQLNESHKKWVSKNIKDYQFTFDWGCFCPPEHNKPVIISVRSGVLTSVKYADGSGAVDKTKYTRYRTIEGLFEFMQDAINRKAYKIEVSYDATLGYPTFASIDYNEKVSDEEMSFKAGGLIVDAR